MGEITIELTITLLSYFIYSIYRYASLAKLGSTSAEPDMHYSSGLWSLMHNLGSYF